MSTDLPARSGHVLATVVREYIQTGEPVASVVIARRGAVSVSPATIRNILARLEEQGFVRQPHTSAGRVPTDRGYRFYVDLLLNLRRPSRATTLAARLRQQTGDTPAFDDLLGQVSHLLSTESRHVGFAISPARGDARLHKVEFVSLAASRVMVIIVATSGQVWQKVVDIGEPLGPEELRRAAEYLNREFHGQPVAEVRDAVGRRLLEDRTLYDRLRARAFELASRTLAEAAEQHTLHLEGAATLLDEASQPHSALPLSTLRALLEMIEEKQRLVRLLGEYLEGPGLSVVIGAEHTDPHLRPFSLVASTFAEGNSVGSVGVIGPTRMHYSRTIAMVDDAARAVSELLSPSN
jgi:heat-inducible transcriptional repressor